MLRVECTFLDKLIWSSLRICE